MKRLYIFALSLVIVLGFSAFFFSSAKLPQSCLQDARFDTEIYGPTDVNGAMGNQFLSTAVNTEGTITVFKYPYRSYWDQVKYHTDNRSQRHFGAEPNEGSFLGLIITMNGESSVSWLRGDDWESDMGYADNMSSDALLTTYTSPRYGLKAEVRDVVSPGSDVLIRNVSVEKTEESGVDEVELVQYANFNLVTSKDAFHPTQDWCYEEENTDEAWFNESINGVVHWKEYNGDGDAGVNSEMDIAIGVSMKGDVDQFQVGGDNLYGHGNDAYLDAQDGELTGDTYMDGQNNIALTQQLDLSNGSDQTSVYIAGAVVDRDNSNETIDTLTSSVEQRGFEAVRREKASWFDEKIGDAPMPSDPENENITKLARRALMDAVIATTPGLHSEHRVTQSWERNTTSTISSMTTQPPYGLDWPRGGAWINYVLSRAHGNHDTVRRHNLWYTDLQHPNKNHALGVIMPEGSWAMAYYHDGTVGAPIPWQIDETSYTIWSLTDHHRVTGNDSYLREVYPEIKRATDNVLVNCRDSDTGLQCRSWEDDNVEMTQTMMGAASVYAGLEEAIYAAEELGEQSDASRWSARQDELEQAIDTHLWNESEEAYGIHDKGFVSPRTILPACYKSFDDPRIQSHMDAMWRDVNKTFSDERLTGQYETKHLNALAEGWRGDEEKMNRVRMGLDWIADEWATPGTHMIGEAWIRKWEDGEPYLEQGVAATVGQPHTWEEIQFYQAAIKAYPPSDEVYDEFSRCA